MTTTRMLPVGEWQRVFDLYSDSFPGRYIPLPPDAECAVVEEDGEIVAAMFLVQVLHMEPYCARKGHGGKFHELAQFLEERLAEASGGSVGYCTTAPNDARAWSREEQLGRTVMHGHVPVMKVLGPVEVVETPTTDARDARSLDSLPGVE